VDYLDDRIAFSDWSTLKPKTPYGQVPVWSDESGNMKAQSGAMLRYLAKKHSETLYPDDALYDIEEALGVISDIKNSWAPCLYMGMRPEAFGHPKGFGKTDEGKALTKEVRQAWLQNEVPKLFGHLESLLERHNNAWLASSKHPTIADCDAVPFLRSFTKGHIDHVPKDCFEKDHPKLVDYVKRFCALPEIEGRYTDGLH